jgi:hypothetical protein
VLAENLRGVAQFEPKRATAENRKNAAMKNSSGGVVESCDFGVARKRRKTRNTFSRYGKVCARPRKLAARIKMQHGASLKNVGVMEVEVVARVMNWSCAT